MHVQIKSTGFNLSNDTVSLELSPERVMFFEHHDVPYTTFFFKTEERMSWDESMSDVEIPVHTIKELRKYCEQYNCTFEFSANEVLIVFK